MAQFYLKFLLITQHEVPFINTSEATKKVERSTRERLMYKCHEPYKSCRLSVNYTIPSFRISVDFPSFRLLGFEVIFRRSVIPLFRHSAVPSFRLLGSPVLKCADQIFERIYFILTSMLLVEANKDSVGISRVSFRLLLLRLNIINCFRFKASMMFRFASPHS